MNKLISFFLRKNNSTNNQINSDKVNIEEKTYSNQDVDSFLNNHNISELINVCNTNYKFTKPQLIQIYRNSFEENSFLFFNENRCFDFIVLLNKIIENNKISSNYDTHSIFDLPHETLSYFKYCFYVKNNGKLFLSPSFGCDEHIIAMIGIEFLQKNPAQIGKFLPADISDINTKIQKKDLNEFTIELFEFISPENIKKTQSILNLFATASNLFNQNTEQIQFIDEKKIDKQYIPSSSYTSRKLSPISNKILIEIKKLYEEIQLYKNDIDDFNIITKLYQEKIPNLIHNYYSVPENLKTALDNKNKSPEDLLNDAFEKIKIIYSEKLFNIKSSKTESAILALNVDNNYLNSVRNNMN